jgi:uncharacterized membrane protein YphA (DoxX/SURF4 family)
MDVPGWKSGLSWVSSLLLCAVFLSSGLWKITGVQGWAVRMVQAKVPEPLGLAAALTVGIAETVGAAMILVPRLRRWGALLLGALLVAFMGYFAIQYNALRGADCSCFPWLKRVVGPGFFVGDGVMLALAVLAGLGSRRPQGMRTVALILAAVAVFAGVSYGVGAARETGTLAPESVLVDGRPYSLEHGKVFLFYFDPACMHCFESADRPGTVRGAVYAGHGLPHGDYHGPGQAEGSVPLRGSAGGSGDRGRAAEGGAGEIRRRGTGGQLEATRADPLRLAGVPRPGGGYNGTCPPLLLFGSRATRGACWRTTSP